MGLVKFFIIAALAVFLSALLIGSFFYFKQTRPSNNIQNTKQIEWKAGKELVETGVTASPGKVLHLDFQYDRDQSPVISLVYARIYNGYAPTYPKVEQSYKLEILDDDRALLNTIDFVVPSQPLVDPRKETEEEFIGPDQRDSVQFALTIPYITKIYSIRIIDSSSTTVLETPIEPTRENNELNFYSIYTGKPQSNNIRMYLPKPALANLEQKKLNITFIGNNYQNPDKFKSDIERYFKFLLSIEPFKTRASQFSFNFVPNDTDLGCAFTTSGEGLGLFCNDSLAQKIVIQAGVPFDKIAVLHNSNRAGGSAHLKGSVSYVTNAPGEELAFVHELGHSIGGLVDEYLARYPFNASQNQVFRNCYTGSPPAIINDRWWIGVTTYFKGCNFTDWYRSSDDSIMRSLSIPRFNLVSQRIINEAIDEIAGPMPGANPNLCECKNSVWQGTGCSQETAGTSCTTSSTDPAECKERQSCIYSEKPGQCYQGACVDKTKPCSFNLNCGKIQTCPNTYYNGKLQGQSVACPQSTATTTDNTEGTAGIKPGTGTSNANEDSNGQINIKDIPFFGVIIGPDSKNQIADLKADAQRKLSELGDFNQSLSSLAQKTSDPVVKRLIDIATGKASLAATSANACIK